MLARAKSQTASEKFIFHSSALLALRTSKTTPDKMKVHIKTQGGSLEYDIVVLKIISYQLKEILKKKLYFLIPFYIFSHEAKFEEYVKDEKKLEHLKEEYGFIKNELEQICQDHEIDEYTRCTLIDMSNKILEHIAAKYPKVKEGVKNIMGGQILDYEAKTIKNQGREEGRAEGHKKLAKLMEILLNESRIDDLILASKDIGVAEKLYKEFKIE